MQVFLRGFCENPPQIWTRVETLLLQAAPNSFVRRFSRRFQRRFNVVFDVVFHVVFDVKESAKFLTQIRKPAPALAKLFSWLK
jgi:hypothetical protein